MRIIRKVMLKGGGFADILTDLRALLMILVIIAATAMLRYKRTLD